MAYEKELEVACGVLENAWNKYMTISDSNEIAKFDLIETIMRNLKMAFEGDAVVTELYSNSHFVSSRTWTVSYPDKQLINRGAMNKYFSIQVSLVHAKELVLSIIYFPFLHDTYHAILDQGAYLNKRPIKVRKNTLDKACVSFSQFDKINQTNNNIQLEMMKNLKENVDNIYMFNDIGINFAYVASGLVDGFVLFTKNICDVNPGMLLCKEAGAQISTIEGKSYTFQDNNIMVTTSVDLMSAISNSRIPRSADTAEITRIGYFGLQSSFAEESAERMAYKKGIKKAEYYPYQNIDTMCEALETGKIHYLVIPTRNGNGTTCSDTLSIVNSYNVELSYTDQLPISLNIYKRNRDVKGSEINTVVASKPIFEYADRAIRILMPKAYKQESADVSIAARLLSNGELPDNMAVVCSKETGDLYHLCLVQSAVEVDNGFETSTLEHRMFEKKKKF